MLSIYKSDEGQACEQLKETLLHMAQAWAVSLFYEVQILIGFTADTVSLTDNKGFVLTNSENLISKGESVVISLIILLTNRGDW